MMNHTKDNQPDTSLQTNPFAIPGHPLHTLRQENLALEAFIEGPFMLHLEALETEDGPELRNILLEDVATLKQIEKHYRRIEELMLPFMGKIGQIAPAKVMVAIHSDVLRMIRDLRDDLLMTDSEPNGIRAFAAFLIRDIQIVMRQEREAYADQAKLLITEYEWIDIARASDAIGYCMISPPAVWPAENS